jgi:hypothetical protein
VTEHDQAYDALPLVARRRLSEVCRAFERAWRGGQMPELEPFVHDVAGPERQVFLQELVLLDLQFRKARGDDHPVSAYLDRFPELDRTWLEAAGANGAAAATVLHVAPAGGDGAALLPLADAGLELLEEIGRGAMGVVYRARQRGLDRVVAVKMILAGDHADPASLQRFRVEALATARVDHDGIVRVHDAGLQGGQPCIVMEYVPGGNLKDKLDGTPWPGREAAAFVERLARIIQAAHDRHIVHRDLKPGNILLTLENQPKITDFGLAKLLDDGPALSATGLILGTPSYMAPEQASGKNKEIGPAADIYALGAILYELLTGRPPFRGATTTDTLLQVVEGFPVPPRDLNPQIDRDLETVCLKCLEKVPARRYARAADLAEDLDRYGEGRPVRARPPGWTDALFRGLTRRNLVARADWGKLAVAMGCVSFGAGLAMHWLVHTEQPPLAWFFVVGSIWLATGLAFAHYLRPRRHYLTAGERHLLSLWGGYVAAGAMIWVVLGAPLDRSVLTTYYPVLAVVTGLCYLVQGSVYWGRFYLLGVGYFVLAVIMRLTPDWSAVEMALFQGTGNWVKGWYLLRHSEE